MVGRVRQFALRVANRQTFVAVDPSAKSFSFKTTSFPKKLKFKDPAQWQSRNGRDFARHVRSPTCCLG